jgi:3' exoribonuclease, RNase T-like
MKYFLDTEFIEGPQDKRFCGIKVGETKPTIDLISIGLVSEDGREYYAISNEFNLHEAWNRYQIENGQKVYWIRDNVLQPIWHELATRYLRETESKNASFRWILKRLIRSRFTEKAFTLLIKQYGISNKRIANNICEFIYEYEKYDGGSGMCALEAATKYECNDPSLNPEFYAYFADYDWVAFCWLFGKMNDLPKGFPHYCQDIQQMKDELWEKVLSSEMLMARFMIRNVKHINDHPNYPKQDPAKQHHALEDAKHDRELYNFLIGLNVK